jgi:hypothetical protein
MGFRHEHPDLEPARIAIAEIGDLAARAFDQAELISEGSENGALAGLNGKIVATLRS